MAYEIEELTEKKEELREELNTRSFYKKYYELKADHEKLKEDFIEFQGLNGDSEISFKTQFMFTSS